MRSALRNLLPWPTAILTLGIGLSVAIFSVVEAVILNPLPFPDQAEIHMIWKTDLQSQNRLVGELAFADLGDIRANIADIESAALIPAALYGNGRVLQAGTQDPIQVETCPTTAALFQVLKVKPALGRDFETSDENPNSPPVVMLSDRVWREHFGARRDAVGQMVRLNGIGHTIIGVMPGNVDFLRGAGLWIPLKTELKRGATWLIAIARTKPGLSRDALQLAADRMFQLQATTYPEQYTPSQRAIVTPLSEYWTGASRPQLLISLAAALLLLISACVSASNLFLSRTLLRRREVATRLALGASRAQILIFFGAEALACAIAATVAGSLLAAALIRLLVRWAPADIPRVNETRLDLGALGFAGAVAILAAVACVVGPAFILQCNNLEAALREGVRTAGSRTGRRLQLAFVFAQSALTVAILAVGLLLFLSYQAMLNTDLGFAHRDTLTMNLAARGPLFTPEKRRLFYAELLDKLRAAPEVASASAILLRPFEGPIGWDTAYWFEYEAATRNPDKLIMANFEVATPGYFATVGTRLSAGRDFTDHDTPDSEKVAIISESMAARIRSAGRDPLTHRVHVFGAWWRVVGITADARYRRVVQTADNVYVPYTQVGVPTNYLMLRGRTTPGELLALVRRTLKQVDPTQAIAGEATLGQMIDRNTAGSRFNVSILTLFAIGAIVLAAAGIHSVVRESVTARTKEIAVRVALGASRERLVAQMTRRTLAWVVAGEIAGIAAAVVLIRAASDLVYGVTPANPVVIAAVVGFMFTIAAGASFLPAWSAAGKDPREGLQNS